MGASAARRSDQRVLVYQYQVLAMMQTGGGAIVTNASSLGKLLSRTRSEYIAAKPVSSDSHAQLQRNMARAGSVSTQCCRASIARP